MHYIRSAKKIVLVRPPYSLVYKVFGKLPKHREIRPPLGLLSMAGSLLNHGYDVQIVDGEPHLDSIETMVRKIVAHDPDFVGITSTTPEIGLAAEIIRSIKKRLPKTITILGGAHASAMPEQSLEAMPQLDYLVVGEGENAIVEIVNHRPVEKIIHVPGVKDLDLLPMPAKHLVNAHDYSYPNPVRGLVVLDAIETSRGCPYNCIFCFHLNGRQVRFKSTERVIEELKQSRFAFGAEMVMFFDDTFTLDKRRARSILEQAMDARINLKYHCFTRVDTLDSEILALMRAAGFANLTMGVESGDQTMLDRINKGTRLEDYRRVYAMASQAGLETRGSFMVGNPYESWETVKASIQFARHLDLYRIGVNIATPYPGTKLYDMALAGEGLRLEEPDWRQFTRWGKSVISTPDMSAYDLEQAQLLFLSHFYSNPKVVKYHARRFLNGNRSFYYYRPLLWSLARRGKQVFRRSFA